MDRVASVNRYPVPVGVLYAKKMMPKKRFNRDLSYVIIPAHGGRRFQSIVDSDSI
jgi:hypothetical protein